MNYLINRENFRQFSISEINKLSPRAYFIPYSSREELQAQSVLTERYNSDKVVLLSGEWDFKYYEKDMLIPNSFYTERIQFDKVTVPGTWQRTGYREPCYLNTRYEFDPTLYPEVPQDVPMGIYRKIINIDDTDKVRIITFLGVISSLDLYVNGKFVGYSEGAHNSAEFDITDYVSKGENEILAVVSKWSTGTYLECQDMFRENGIFRDVYITETEKTYIYDYFANSEKRENGKYNLDVSAVLQGETEGYTLSAELYDGEILISALEEKASNEMTLDFGELEVKEWNAEEPYTYTLYITLKNGEDTLSVIRAYIGFKTVEIKGNVFYFNGRPIKFKGVNHHDTNCKTGYVLPLDEIEKELKLMKEFNINSIRTSHYPPDPTLLTLADLMGFYIVDEADIETHGAFDCKKPGTPNLISNDLKWAPRYVDRVSRMYYRDRTHPSITMWSLGNEAGGWKCQDACYDFIKKQGSKIPVHYEGVVRNKRFAYDVISEMYPWHEHFKKVGEGKELPRFKKKPFFMCEYCHAMGVGPGCLEEYWESIYAHDNLMGGCIWEWADHAVYHDGSDKYKTEYTYGGDHGEKKHDGNFCVDGMLYPDKTPHTGAYVIKNVYRPVRSRHVSGKVFEFTNTNRFKNSSYLRVEWARLINGVEVEKGEIKLDIEPMQTKTYEIPYSEYSMSDDCHINIAYFDGDTRVGIEQTVLNDVKRYTPSALGIGKVMPSLNNGILTVSFDGGCVKFNQKTGEMIEYMNNGKNYLNSNPADGIKGFMPNLTRASLDNDTYGVPKKPWDISGLLTAKTTIKDFSYADKSYYTVVAVNYEVKKSFRKLFDASVIYVIHSDGLVNVDCILNKTLLGPTDIQRFGVCVELPEEFSNIEFYGRGSDEKMENLCDMNDHTTVGVYKTTVKEMHEPYIMPQDNGNCGGVKYLKLSNDNGNVFEVYGEPKFSFSAHDYTKTALDKAKHREEIEYANSTVLSIDGFMRGTGTKTCGPDTLPKYRIKTEKPLRFKFSFKGN